MSLEESKTHLEMVEMGEKKQDAKVESADEDIPLGKQMKDCFNEWTLASSAPSIVQLARASCWVIRIMWIILILAAIGGTGYFVIMTFISYFQYGVLNQINIAKQYPTYYPAVTICNLNPFNNNKSKIYIDDLLTANNYSDFISISDTDAIENKYGSNNTIQLLDSLLENLRRWIATDKNLTETTRRVLGFEMAKDMLVSCSFNGKTCSETDFKYSRSYKYGNCFTYNAGFNSANTKVDILQTSKTGTDGGLSMELQTGDPKNEVRFAYKSGIYVMVHNQSFTPLELGDSGVYVPTGFDSFISIERQFFSKQPAPYSNCIDDFSAPPNDYAKKLYGYMSDSGASSYSQDFCGNVCYQDQLIDKCNCADAELPALRGAVYCTNTSQLTCMSNFKITFSSANIDTQCQSACPVKCNTIDYILSLTNAMYPSAYYISLLQSKSEITDDFDLSTSTGTESLREALVKITINYETLQYEQIQEIPQYTPDVFVGNLGGQLGVFIGITFLSFFDIVHLIIDLVRIYILHRKKLKKNSVQPAIF